MEIFQNYTSLNKNVSGSALILGFFDGVHRGHRKVIESAVNSAKKNNSKSVLITFKDSPAEYFGHEVKYIYPREYSYKLVESLGVDYLIENDFSSIAGISAEKYLQEYLVKNFEPISISTGFNHTFGANRLGNADFLKENSKIFNYQYFCSSSYEIENVVVSSTKIREFLQDGCIEKANEFLGAEFCIHSNVIKGNAIGRTIGFPTANSVYPQDIIKIPHGVYKAKVFGLPAVLNWGVKPTVGSNKEVLEVHIPNFNQELYGKTLKIEIIGKIRDEKKFDSIEDLKLQIQKDVEECLK